ncbi:hypothetical protein JJC00_08940 [Bradyrhizobium diazoefficiens]|uniref:hypothetical protein n=1 Tax=Bradyrhizobium diazoefficiens TaxID=1355477 RepID=UPI00190D9871|nr:hypothetical protein [Bradyrhizobium diazoefficiens]QQO35680.1 hypothetical protein JJC00_08940 [Bradyrhizobium diazoefficiens]
MVIVLKGDLGLTQDRSPPVEASKAEFEHESIVTAEHALNSHEDGEQKRAPVEAKKRKLDPCTPRP